MLGVQVDLVLGAVQPEPDSAFGFPAVEVIDEEGLDLASKIAHAAARRVPGSSRSRSTDRYKSRGKRLRAWYADENAAYAILDERNTAYLKFAGVTTAHP
jgi:hypothetical protein